MRTIELPDNVKDYAALIAEFDHIRPNDFVPHPNLQYMHDVLAALGNPHNHMGEIFHITGTNGKGSTSWTIARALEQQSDKIKVGSYISPHLYSHRERISINGIPIDKADMVRIANHVFATLKKEQPDIYLGMVGILVCIAFCYFKEKQVNYTIVEAGIGAKHDHTNVVTPCVSIITSIGWDHMKMLGDSLRAIAEDKAHIVKSGVPIVISSQVASEPKILAIVEAAVARNEGSKLYTSVESDARNYALANRSTALCALQVHFDDRAFQLVGDALRTAPPARYQSIVIPRLKWPVIFDAAHNSSAFEKLFSRFEAEHGMEQAFVLVLGIAATKDLDGCSEVIARYKQLKRVYVLGIEGGHQQDEMSTALKEQCVDAVSYTNFSAVSEYAKEQNCHAIVAGSFKSVLAISDENNVNLTELRNTINDQAIETSTATSGVETIGLLGTASATITPTDASPDIEAAAEKLLKP